MGNTSCTDALYVDESKKSDYLLIAVSVPQQHLSHIKKVLKSLLLPGQKRIHMKNEKDSRRRMIVRNILTHMPRDFRVTVYCCPKNAGYKQIKMRKLCIENMAWHQKDSTSTIILESDATMDRQDKQQLYNLFSNMQNPVPRYMHKRAEEDILLCLPDIIGWCIQRGGDWRQRIQVLPIEFRKVC